jgi:two-component system, LytTR family, sensor kinase
MKKYRISIKLWLILSSIIIIQGLLSTFSSYLYLLNTNNPVNYFELLSQRIISYTFWVVLIPVIYFAATTIIKDKIRIKEIIILLFIGILISLIHRISIVWINDQLLSSNPSQKFISELWDQKFIFLSLSYDSFFSFVLLVIFIQFYRVSILRREAKIKEESFKTQLAQAELANLKMRFQPHFIFNALHSISATAYKNPEIADSMITKLSELLRHSINSAGNNLATVEEEFQLAKKYIELQKLRFGERINYSEDIDKKSLKEKMPLFVLQPLLENCIKHAVELTDVKIDIYSDIRLSDERLEINISNTSPTLQKEADKSLGEGLQNLRERLHYIYNGNYEFKIKELPGKEFSVSILLPLNHAE